MHLHSLPYLLERVLATDARSFLDLPAFICALRFVKSLSSMTFPDIAANLSCTIFLLAFTARYFSASHFSAFDSFL